MMNVHMNFTEALSDAVDAVEKHSGDAPKEILLGREAYRLFSSGFDSNVPLPLTHKGCKVVLTEDLPPTEFCIRGGDN